MPQPAEPLYVRPFEAADAPVVEPWLDAPGLSVPPGRRLAWAQRLLAEAPRCGLVAALGDRPVGFLRYDPGPDGVAELTIAVAPDARRRGVGAELVAAALDLARASGMRALDAAVDRSNEPALAFFAAHGFERERPCGERVVLRRLVHASHDAEPLDVS